MSSHVAAALPPDQQHFLADAAQAGRFEIEASRIAIVRAGSRAVRSYAEATLRDRVSVDLDLEQLAQSVGATLPARLDDDLQARIAMLEQLNGYEFDRAYAHNVAVIGQERTLAAFERAADRRGERVQRFAAARVPALREHLEWARRLTSQVDKSDMA